MLYEYHVVFLRIYDVRVMADVGVGIRNWYDAGDGGCRLYYVLQTAVLQCQKRQQCEDEQYWIQDLGRWHIMLLL